MNVEELDALPTPQLEQIVFNGSEILRRRHVAKHAVETIELTQRDVLIEYGRGMGAPWQQPEGAHDSYPSGWVVEHEDQFWRNDHSTSSAWEPGSVMAPWIEVWPDGNGGWTDQRPIVETPDTDEPIPPAWQVGMTIEAGDRVTHDGQPWEALLAHTTHEGWIPSPHTHAVWKPVE